MTNRQIGIVLCALLLVWGGYAAGRAMTPTASSDAPALAPAVAADIAELRRESVRQSQLLLGIHATLAEIARRLPAPVPVPVEGQP